ncbi:hypothetical protein J4050_12120 [Winogradskyella sp. DF17]|uniref:KAP NTPase domain-containing protein n=1 Tax=Winogradskyella pelagia TaxID=2819984 RepID=A0ABS3T428_9FLAO|nr:P-loop NTPase fold protein [Winogradskyella sp. DF17]MBO3117500.1 hypothetical protein [Winogradskyella sp. DF17]
MTEQNQYSHIKIEVGVSPVKYNVAFTSINSRGGLGQLNLYVLKELGYDNAEIEKIDVSNGYYLLNNGRNKPILFIVTVGNNEFSGITLQRNLRLALEKHQSFLKSKNVWVPLMATGAGGLDFIDSFNTIRGQLKNYPNTNFTIAVPNDDRGMEFISINSGQGQQNDIDIDFILELLNLEYSIALEKEVPISSGNKKYFFDLADLNNLTFVEFKEQKSAADRANLRKEINSLISSLSQISPKKKSRLVVVINGLLTNNDRKFYDTNLRLLKNEKVVLYDKTDIETLSNKHNLDNNSSKTISDSDVIFNEKYRIHRFVRDVLNQEYSLNLVIEETRTQNGFNIRIDLSDEKEKSYVKIINKDDLIIEAQSRGVTYGKVVSKIAFDITTELKLLGLDNSFIKYFVFFDSSFDNEDIEFVKNKLSDYDTDIFQILTMSDITLLAEKHSIKLIDYFDVENSLNRQVEDSNRTDNGNDKIPFHLDQVVDEDKLGREPVAMAFVRLIKEDIFTEKLNHSFMVHLQGKWGSGKSSFLNFIKKNLNADDENWIVVEYNAWQNQHITPPWWSLIDQVYLKSKEQLNWRACFHLWRKEVLRRIWRYSGWQKITAFFLFTLSLVCIFYFGEDIINLFQETTQVIENDNDISKKSFASKLGDFGKLILTIASLLGTLYGFTKFITIPFFINSSKDAESFVLKASDPMNQVKRHFNDLVDNINNKDKKRQLAIFIDDIDRCDKGFIVQLLEGIQTLFKDKRVLYIVAGDKNWISTSFGNTYEEFKTKSVDKKQLGEFFIQKAFQLSFRLPNISEESKQNYWNHILGLKDEGEKDKIESIEELSEAQQTEIKSVLKQSKSELTNPEFVQNIQEKYNLTGDTATNIVIGEKNKDTEELKHLLQDYHKYIDTNPRSIIRLANNYTMARSILMAERVKFNEHVLFRWLVIEDLCPKVKTIVTTIEKISDFTEIINTNNDVIKRNNCLKLLKGEEEFMEGEITIADIKTIKGL